MPIDPQSKSKQTKRQAYDVLAKRNIVPEELENRPVVPPDVKYIWSWFVEIAQVCESVTFTELKAWQDLKGFTLLSHEVEALMKLERIRRSI